MSTSADESDRAMQALHPPSRPPGSLPVAPPLVIICGTGKSLGLPWPALLERQASEPASRPAVRPYISLITLAVEDLQRAVAFYRDGLGLPTDGVMGTEFEHGAVAFFDLQTGLKLAVWPRTSLAADAGLPLAASTPGSFSLAHNVGSEAEVDDVMAQALKAGGTIVKPAQTAFWGGYAGYFQDPDGHLWEVAFNPDLPVPSQRGPIRPARGSAT